MVLVLARATIPPFTQWLEDVNQKVMLENGSPVPIILLANKVLRDCV